MYTSKFRVQHVLAGGGGGGGGIYGLPGPDSPSSYAPRPAFSLVTNTEFATSVFIENMSGLPSVRSDLFKDVKFFLADESNEEVLRPVI